MPPPTASEVRQMSKAQLGKLNKDTLIDYLLEVSKDNGGSLQALERKLDSKLDAIQAEILDLKNTIIEKNQVIQGLNGRLDEQDKIIARQQRYLETLDREKRENRLVVTGVPERAELEGETCDERKLAKVWQVLEVEVKPRSFTRLGKESDDRNRPILVTLDSRTERDQILEKKSNLKKKESLKTIFVKKDVHPNVRDEWRRLFEAERTEKARAENVGADIKFDPRKRELTRDGVVIDSWKPNPF